MVFALTYYYTVKMNSLFSLTISLLLTLVFVLKNKAGAYRHAPAALNEGDISTVPSVYSALLC